MNTMITYTSTTTQLSTTRGVSTAEQAARIANQLAHIERMLQEATQRPRPPTWLLVAGHYPIFSSGR
jgi:hypothetical protein